MKLVVIVKESLSKIRPTEHGALHLPIREGAAEKLCKARTGRVQDKCNGYWCKKGIKEDFKEGVLLLVVKRGGINFTASR
jgi:hypothetical protein